MVRLTRASFIVALCTSAVAHAHILVDMKMTVRASPFVPVGQAFTYDVVADNLANDNAVGLVVTDTLAAGVTFVGVTAPGWNCAASKGTVTCSAEQLTPGEHVIALRVTAPTQPSTILNKATVTSLGSFDPQSNNDDATASVTVYDPARCTAAAPALLAPAEDATIDDPVVHFAWTPVAGAARYVVRAATEGAAAAALPSTSSTSAIGVLDRGSGAWWVEAVFIDCPVVASPQRRITTTRAPLVLLSDIITGLQKPAGIAFGPGAELYVTDEEDAVVRLVANGQVTTIAGAPGERGSANGQFARFDHPTGITVTPLDGFLYVADTGNNDVRILYTGGPFVPAFSAAGAAFKGPTAVAATLRGSIYVADTGNGVIRLMTPVPGTTGVFSKTSVGGTHFESPEGVAVDASGNVYVSDRHVIQKIASNGDVSTIAQGLNHPAALALDALGNLYVCDRGDGALRKIAPSGLVTIIAQFADPAGVAVAADGSVYVADAASHAVRRVTVVAAEAPGNRRRAAAH